ncbi:hypothetical protein KDA_71290 [Dictyobacter alpinus]|uniref:Uncharacterized protein n=1 Tax=Dictyobacter alpinus TaxID=2014873 RepID=A0A402BJY1_9CHLR|nr:hypothetical protein KDA_71290 [Dictyobacter alpinus]
MVTEQDVEEGELVVLTGCARWGRFAAIKAAATACILIFAVCYVCVYGNKEINKSCRFGVSIA